MNTTRSVSFIVTNGEGHPIMSCWYGMPDTIILPLLNLWYFLCTSFHLAPHTHAHARTHTHIYTQAHTYKHVLPE